MIVGLGHQAQVGKDTAAGFLVERHGFKRLAFADILKEVLYDMNPIISASNNPVGIIPRYVHLQDIVDNKSWEYAKKSGEVRRLLQELGVAARWHLGENVWVQPIFNRILDEPDTDFVVTDIRFPNEFSCLKSFRHQPATMVKITRKSAYLNTGAKHQSETALAEFEWDYVVPNNGNLIEFEEDLLLCLGLDSRSEGVGVFREAITGG